MADTKRKQTSRRFGEELKVGVVRLVLEEG